MVKLRRRAVFTEPCRFLWVKIRLSRFRPPRLDAELVQVAEESPRRALFVRGSVTLQQNPSIERCAPATADVDLGNTVVRRARRSTRHRHGDRSCSIDRRRRALRDLRGRRAASRRSTSSTEKGSPGRVAWSLPQASRPSPRASIAAWSRRPRPCGPAGGIRLGLPRCCSRVGSAPAPACRGPCGLRRSASPAAGRRTAPHRHCCSHPARREALAPGARGRRRTTAPTVAARDG